MVKTTKQVSGNAGESAAEPVKRKAASRKAAARKAGTESPGAKKTGPEKKAAAKKPVAGKTAAKKPVAGKTTAKTAAPRKKVTTGTGLHRQISSAERRHMIAEAAYLRAESQGFLSDEREDWLLAEAEVDNQLIRADVRVND